MNAKWKYHLPDKNRIKEKYHSMSVPLRATMWVALCQFIQKGIGMITTPIFTRLLSTTEYGRASTFFSWTDILMPIITLSCWRGMMNLFVKDKDKDEVLSSTISLSVIIALFWGTIIVFFRSAFMNLMSFSLELLLGLIIGCLAQNIFNAWTVRMQYDYKYKPLVIITLIYTFCSSFGGVLMVFFVSRTAEARVFSQIIFLALICLLISIISIAKEKKFFCKDIWLFNLSFSIPLIPHYLSEVVLQSSDRIMINNLCNSSEAAIYSVAYAVGSLINLIASVANSAFVPFQYQKIKSEEYATLAKTTNYVIGFVAICLCGLMLFGREIVLIFGGEKYSDSVSLVIPICLGVFFNYVFQLFARLQEYYEQKYTIVIASVLCAILNIILNFICIKQFGYKAAAYTTFICYLIFCFLHYVFYRNICKKNIGHEIYDIKSLLIISATLIIIAIVIKFIEQLPLVKYLLFIVTFVALFSKRKNIIKIVKNMRKD